MCHPITQSRRSGVKVCRPLPHPRSMRLPSLTPYNQRPMLCRSARRRIRGVTRLRPTNDDDAHTKDDDDRRTPRTPSTVHRAQRPWRCAQARDADHQTLPCCDPPNGHDTAQHLPPRRSEGTSSTPTTTVHPLGPVCDADRQAPRSGQCYPPPPSTRLQGAGVAHKHARRPRCKPTTATAVHRNDDSDECRAQGTPSMAPTTPSTGPTAQALRTDTRCRSRKACTPRTTGGGDGARSSTTNDGNSATVQRRQRQRDDTNGHGEMMRGCCNDDGATTTACDDTNARYLLCVFLSTQHRYVS
jgi:hypothetical protein